MLQYFISDLHLEAPDTRIVEALAAFLQDEVRGADEIYILGDLFEAWLGDDDPTDLASLVARHLRVLSRAGTRVGIMHGNRDFLIGEAFARRCGAVLIDADLHRIQCTGRPTLIMHGDTLCTLDEAYLQARKKLRSPAFQQEFLSRSLQERAAFAREARAASLAHTSKSAMDIMDVTRAEVDRIMQAAGVSLLIHGHTHRPNIHTALNESGHRVVLGDWSQVGWYLKAEDERLELVSFPIADQPLQKTTCAADTRPNPD